MFLADVLGTVVSPVQHPILDGERLLLIRPVDPNGVQRGIARIAIDRSRAGVGDRILVVDEGNAGRDLIGDPRAPVKTIVVGVVDYVELGDETVYDHRTGPAPRRTP